MGRKGRSFAAALAAAAFLLLWPEMFQLVAARAPEVSGARGNCVVLVLGYPGLPDGTPGPVEEFRVRSGVEAFRRYACSALILAGGKPHSPLPEAETMAKAAVADGVDPKALILDPESRTTWENLKNTVRYVPSGDVLFIASDATHAVRAKSYLCAQRPDLCAGARIYARWEPASIFWFRWKSSYYNLFATLRDALKRKYSGKLEW